MSHRTGIPEWLAHAPDLRNSYEVIAILPNKGKTKPSCPRREALDKKHLATTGLWTLLWMASSAIELPGRQPPMILAFWPKPDKGKAVHTTIS